MVAARAKPISKRGAARIQPSLELGAAVVAGVVISHPDRVVFSVPRATKLDLARYVERVSDAMVPHVAGRPLTLVRCEKGVDCGCEYMRHRKAWGPSPLRRVSIQEKTKVGEYLIADSAAALVALVQMDVVEIHTWNSSYDEDVERPNRLVFDLDPDPSVTWETTVASAVVVRRDLEELGLASWVKTTGGKGLHVVVPLEPVAPWNTCLDFARAFALSLARRDPEHWTAAMAKAQRRGRIFLDYLRNNRTNTSIAAFSPRARLGAPVSVPIAWRELRPSLDPSAFTIETVPRRLARLRSDPWSGYWTTRQRLTKAARAKLVPRSAVA